MFFSKGIHCITFSLSIFCGVSSHWRICISYGDVTITCEGLQILTYARQSGPWSSKGLVTTKQSGPRRTLGKKKFKLTFSFDYVIRGHSLSRNNYNYQANESNIVELNIINNIWSTNRPIGRHVLNNKPSHFQREGEGASKFKTHPKVWISFVKFPPN